MGNNVKLERIMSDRVIGGVCSGLGRYLGIDPTIIRLIFAISVFLFGSGFLLYIILWAVMPARDNSIPDNTENEDELSPAMTNKGSWTLGLTMIIIGILILMCDFIPYVTIQRLWPIAILAMGIVLIINSLKKTDK